MVRTYCRIGNFLNIEAHRSQSSSLKRLDQTSWHHTIQHALHRPPNTHYIKVKNLLLVSIPGTYRIIEMQHPFLYLLPASMHLPPPMVIRHTFNFLNWTTSRRMDLPQNCVFNHNFDLAFLPLITLIIMDLVVMECLILPPAILLVRHAFQIAIPTAKRCV